MMIRGGRGRPGAVSWRVAVMPSVAGIRMSMSTTSGRSSLASRTAWSPSAASPVTVMSSWVCRIMRNPVRSSASSSAISTVMLTRVPRPAGSGPRR